MVWFALVTIALIGAVLVDHFGLLGRERHPITPGRIAGVTVILIGLALYLAWR